MTEKARTSESQPQLPAVPWEYLVRFVRQLSHDLRNHLNAMELQATLLSEMIPSEELKHEVKRLREMISETSGALQKLTTDLSPAQPFLMPYRAADFIEDLKAQLVKAFPKESGAVEWKTKLESEILSIDPQLCVQAALEIFANAFEHGRAEGHLLCSARIEQEKFVLEFREPKEKFGRPTENWGREALQSSARGHYGLGLHRARAIIESQSGMLKAHYDPENSTLITTIALPLAHETA